MFRGHQHPSSLQVVWYCLNFLDTFFWFSHMFFRPTLEKVSCLSFFYRFLKRSRVTRWPMDGGVSPVTPTDEIYLLCRSRDGGKRGASGLDILPPISRNKTETRRVSVRPFESFDFQNYKFQGGFQIPRGPLRPQHCIGCNKERDDSKTKLYLFFFYGPRNLVHREFALI